MRGRYDLILKYVANHPGCTNADILAHVRSVSPDDEKQVAGYLKVLDERYQMIQRLQPIFAKPSTRNGRFYLRDNFLRAWLAALAIPVASMNFRQLDELVSIADKALEDVEGPSLERLVATLYEERSRKGLGFPLSSIVRGWWDRSGTEVDLVAVNHDERVIRLGTCKRSAERLISDLNRFDGHIVRFLEGCRSYGAYKLVKVAIAPVLIDGQRREIVSRGYLPESLDDLMVGLR